MTTHPVALPLSKPGLWLWLNFCGSDRGRVHRGVRPAEDSWSAVCRRVVPRALHSSTEVGPEPGLTYAATWVLGDRIVPHRLPADNDDHRVLWTAPRYVEQAQIHAAADYEHQEKQAAAEQRRRQRRQQGWGEPRTGQDWRAVMPMGRRFRLEAAAARWVRADSGWPARLGHEEITEPRWAGGLPVYAAGRPYAVLRPAAHRAGGTSWPGWWS
ncbi:hypothetical protein ACFWOG_27865 [Kitasatospora sp. NPDC058406]|uniref:hypothetical protein n=1 Tax=Kitasatospora sp. NPDC058406 TaxID=3346483 RepID=UPI0036600B7C